MLLAGFVWMWLAVWWLFSMVVAFALLLVLGCCWLLGLLLIGFGVVNLVLLVLDLWVCWFWVLDLLVLGFGSCGVGGAAWVLRFGWFSAIWVCSLVVDLTLFMASLVDLDLIWFVAL